MKHKFSIFFLFSGIFSETKQLCDAQIMLFKLFPCWYLVVQRLYVHIWIIWYVIMVFNWVCRFSIIRKWVFALYLWCDLCCQWRWEKPYEYLPTGKKAYLDEQDVTFLDPQVSASCNPAAYLWLVFNCYDQLFWKLSLSYFPGHSIDFFIFWYVAFQC